MNPNDGTVLACSGLPAADGCADALPDNPQCALNYHFGMLLGVHDFQVEQGFHVGRLRRHQRLLHGSGVVAGYPVAYDTTSFDLSVGPGYAIDVLGRDLSLAAPQCVNLALWWQKHSGDDDFATDNPNDATVDLALRVCYATCLDRAVPAIAEPCAGDAASDIAYSRLCETVTLALVKHVDPPPLDPGAQPMHLLRMWLGIDPPARDSGGNLLPDDSWLIEQVGIVEALPAALQGPARAALLRELTARAVAALPPDAPDLAADADACITLAVLRGVHITNDANGWTVTVGTAGEIEFADRPTLLSSDVLQTLLLADPPAVPVPAGPIVVVDGATLAGSTVSLTFSQPLAAASVTAAAFAVSEFDATTGWQTFTLAAPTVDTTQPARPVVTLALDRAPTGAQLRIAVFGTGSTPLLGSNWIPAGARRADSDGRNLTTTLTL